jgi:hypothetical protein
MAKDEETGREKKVTAATTDAPQEEFISPENVPSVPEPKQTQEPSPAPTAPKRE